MINIRIKLFLLAGTILCFLALRWQGKDLPQAYAQSGIVSLELAYKAVQVDSITNGWKNDGILPTARKNVWLDFVFIPFYVLLFYTLCGSISVRMHGFVATMGVLLAFFSLIAGILDAIENTFMLFDMQGMYNDLTAMCTAICASLKFLLLSIALAYVLVFGSRVLLLKLI